MVRGDGDGWSIAPGGERRWGRHGAAGLLLRAPGEDGPVVLLQHRAFWSHHGGTWGLPGGARDSHESAAQTALREAAEETGVHPGDVAVRAEQVTTPTTNGWSYTTVVADAAKQLATWCNGESAQLRWVAEQEVDKLPLHPGFAASWPALRARPVLLFGDLRPDGDVPHGPRTLVLPDGRYGWARRTEPGPIPATLPPDRLCVLATAHPESVNGMSAGVVSVDVATLRERPA